MVLNEDDDFGFSLVSEQELKAQEELLKKKLEEQNKVVQTTTVEYQNKLEGVMAMIMPLINNLCKDPDKEYIHWPNRTKKIEEFRKKIDKLLEE